MGIVHVSAGTSLSQAEFENGNLHSGFGNNNIIFNGGFTINQRVYVSTAALAAGVYGHDRWKAGAGGGDYSFTQLASPTTITIAANKTLIQVVENKNVYGGTYVLSWAGTCQARYAINSATPVGAYADSPITIAGQTAGTTMSVEFGKGAASGTLGLAQLELGSVATSFEFRPYSQELRLCQPYYEKNYNLVTPPGSNVIQGSHLFTSRTADQTDRIPVRFMVEKIALPTIVLYSITGAAGYIRNVDDANNVAATTAYAGQYGFFMYPTANLTANKAYAFYWTAEIEL